MAQFVKPDFKQGELELRIENNEICIYGTPEGLRQLAKRCLQLVEQPAQQHIHLDTPPGLLTEKSVKGAIAIFNGKSVPRSTRIS